MGARVATGHQYWWLTAKTGMMAASREVIYAVESKVEMIGTQPRIQVIGPILNLVLVSSPAFAGPQFVAGGAGGCKLGDAGVVAGYPSQLATTHGAVAAEAQGSTL